MGEFIRRRNYVMKWSGGPAVSPTVEARHDAGRREIFGEAGPAWDLRAENRDADSSQVRPSASEIAK